MSLDQLMEMHLKIFSIVDNLHDFTCRGIKDYKEALGNVNDYNMTKLFTHQCGIPSKNGVNKETRCEVVVIDNLNKDIHLYNYVDICIRRDKLGIL